MMPGGTGAKGRAGRTLVISPIAEKASPRGALLILDPGRRHSRRWRTRGKGEAADARGRRVLVLVWVLTAAGEYHRNLNRNRHRNHDPSRVHVGRTTRPRARGTARGDLKEPPWATRDNDEEHHHHHHHHHHYHYHPAPQPILSVTAPPSG